jgi:hypothetical protein
MAYEQIQPEKQTIFIVIEGGILQYLSTNMANTNVILIDRDSANGEIVALIQPDSIHNNIKQEMETLTDKTEIITMVKNDNAITEK